VIQTFTFPSLLTTRTAPCLQLGLPGPVGSLPYDHVLVMPQYTPILITLGGTLTHSECPSHRTPTAGGPVVFLARSTEAQRRLVLLVPCGRWASAFRGGVGSLTERPRPTSSTGRGHQGVGVPRAVESFWGREDCARPRAASRDRTRISVEPLRCRHVSSSTSEEPDRGTYRSRANRYSRVRRPSFAGGSAIVRLRQLSPALCRRRPLSWRDAPRRADDLGPPERNATTARCRDRSRVATK
jgi:hypothetical protein